MTLKAITTNLAKIVYGLILPAYLLWFVFFSHYQYERSALVAQYRQQMEESLDLLVNLHRDETFFHALFQKNFSLADHHKDPLVALSSRISALKKTFPGSLQFVVWDHNGQINSTLSDEKKFQYILKTMFQVTKEIHEHYLSSPQPKPQQLKSVNQKIKLLRGYFGQFFLPELVLEFFKPSYLGSVITVSELTEKRKFWLYTGENFFVACFIDYAVFDKRIGPRLLIRKFNSRNEDCKLGYLTTIDYKSAGLPANPMALSEFKLEVRKFEENATSFCESKNFLILFRQVSPDLIVLSYLKLAEKLPNPSEKASFLLFSVLKWLLITLFVLHCFILRYPGLCLNIQQKFLFLFLFANGLPALILISTGYEYFNEKKITLIDAQQQESIRVLREIDARYPAVRTKFASQLNPFIDKINEKFGAREWDEEHIQLLSKMAMVLEPGKVFLMDRAQKRRISYSKAGKPEEDEFLQNFFNRSLEFLNNNDHRRDLDSDKSALESISSEDMVFYSFLTYVNRLTKQNTGLGESWAYVKLLGDFREFNSWGFFSVLWSPEELLAAFLQQNLSQMEQAVYPREIGFMEINSEKVIPDRLAGNPKLKRLLHQTITRKLLLDNDFILNGKHYLFCGISGNEIEEGILMSLYPRDLIEKEISHFKLVLFIIGLFIFLVIVQIVRLFSTRLLVPVEGLSNGIEEIRQRNFRYRVDFVSEDELGQLIKAFNATMEGLRELAIGTAVQESLLPDGNYRNSRIEIFARSVFMTKMGGDYFDYFETQPGRLGIFFGDVAGHGIPAAMIMAMAKAVIASSSVRFQSPSDMLQQANSVLLFLKERKLRRMMTCQCLDLNCTTGEFTIANAGHCYPIIISENGKNTEFVTVNGMPLGNKSRKPYEEINVKLQPGETLILYTDGIVEATNSMGVMFDYQRFRELLVSSWDENLETFWTNIMAGNRTWAKEQDDDLTFMIIRYNR